MNGVAIGIPSPETLRWVAGRLIDMHRREGYVQLRCEQCPDADPLSCPQYRWARTYLAMHTEGEA